MFLVREEFCPKRGDSCDWTGNTETQLLNRLYNSREALDDELKNDRLFYCILTEFS